MPKIPSCQLYQIYNEDCFETFKRIPEGSIDMVMCDPPYGTTACKWDSIIPLEPMWLELKRIVRLSTAIVIMSAQPFTSVLICSNLKSYKYSWVWDKVDRPTGHLNSKKQPLRMTEDISVFYQEQSLYVPQLRSGFIHYKVTSGSTSKGTSSNNYSTQVKTVSESDGTRFPINLLSLKPERGKKVHSTQKPVALMEYLIKTYTNEGDKVLDFAMGSGTTGVACGNLGRRFIGCDSDVEHGYFQIAKERIEQAYAQNTK